MTSDDNYEDQRRSRLDSVKFGYRPIGACGCGYISLSGLVENRILKIQQFVSCPNYHS